MIAVVVTISGDSTLSASVSELALGVAERANYQTRALDIPALGGFRIGWLRVGAAPQNIEVGRAGSFPLSWHSKPVDT